MIVEYESWRLLNMSVHYFTYNWIVLSYVDDRNFIMMTVTLLLGLFMLQAQDNLSYLIMLGHYTEIICLHSIIIKTNFISSFILLSGKRKTLYLDLFFWEGAPVRLDMDCKISSFEMEHLSVLTSTVSHKYDRRMI